MTQIQDEQAPKNCWYCGDEGLPEYEHHPCGVRMNCAVCGQRTPLEEGMDNALQNWNEQQEPTEFTLDKLQAAAKGMGYVVVSEDDIAQTVDDIRLNREYVGAGLLPPIDGWSWWDATARLMKAMGLTDAEVEIVREQRQAETDKDRALLTASQGRG